MIAYLCLGSNMGDAAGFVARAGKMIADAFPCAAITAAEPTVSAPWGYESANTYVNQMLRLDIPDFQPNVADALRLLDTLQGIERKISCVPHRHADGTYRDREIDIDIIAIEGLRLNHPRLVLPHPRAASRPFVTVPLATIATNAADLLG